MTKNRITKPFLACLCCVFVACNMRVITKYNYAIQKYYKNKNLNAQFDIIDETINLMNEAAAEVRKLTFAEALEIVKIQRLEQIAKSIDGVANELYSYL